ncbi:MAG TPA: DUF4252 domain-containing protein [Salegentibacter sp.]|uniref:DUF4252 domain-containing protein n=1 Tax=Salegentibacter sp. TaxID=1903072 RepID=UPI002F94229F
MKTSGVFGFLFVLMFLTISCGNEPGIQEYYVENLGNSDFIAMDIPANLLANIKTPNADQKQILESIHKVNLLVYPLRNNKEMYQAEKVELQKILKNENYQLLMRYGSTLRKAEIYFIGDESAVDEFILFGFDDSRGVGLARILGEDMQPQAMLNLLRSLKKGDLNVDGIRNIAQIFKRGRLK